MTSKSVTVSRNLFTLVVEHTHALSNLEPLRQAMLAIAQEREPLLETITVQAVNLLKADSGGIHELDDARQELSVVAAHNLPTEIIGQKLKVGRGLAGQLINRTLDYMAEPNYSEWEGRAVSENVKALWSVIGVPLISDSKRTGVLWVKAAKGRIFDQTDIEMLKGLAVHASIALEQSRLKEKERNRAMRLERLASATFDVLSQLTTSGPKETLTLIAGHAHQILDAEACEILLVEEPGWLSVVASHGHREGSFEEGRRFEIVSGRGTGLTGHIASVGTVFREYGEALANHPAVKNKGSDCLPSGECFSLLAIPLSRREGELRGILRISNKKRKDGRANQWTSFSEDDQSIGEIFAQAALIAIETAELMSQAEAMSQALEHHIPKLDDLPLTLPRDGAIQLELEEGVLIFRVSEAVQDRIEVLLDKQRSASLSVAEAEELQQYEDIDDYLSFNNRLLRNLAQV